MERSAGCTRCGPSAAPKGSMDMKKSQLKTHISGQGWTCVGQAYRNTLALRILCAPLTGALPH